MCLALKDFFDEKAALFPGNSFLCRLKQRGYKIVLCHRECNGCVNYDHKAKECGIEEDLVMLYQEGRISFFNHSKPAIDAEVTV